MEGLFQLFFLILPDADQDRMALCEEEKAGRAGKVPAAYGKEKFGTVIKGGGNHMEEIRLDSVIRETLEQSASGVSMPSDLQRQIKQTIRSKTEKESIGRHFSKRKVVVLAVTMCLVGSMAVAAAGKVTGWSSSTYTARPDYRSYTEVSKAEGKLGCPGIPAY